jgi:hypothetical protein
LTKRPLLSRGIERKGIKNRRIYCGSDAHINDIVNQTDLNEMMIITITDKWKHVGHIPTKYSEGSFIHSYIASYEVKPNVIENCTLSCICLDHQASGASCKHMFLAS